MVIFKPLKDGTITKEFLGYFGMGYLPYALVLILWIARRKCKDRKKAAQIQTVTNSRQAECAELISSCKENGFPIDKHQMKSLTSAHNENTAKLDQTCQKLSALENEIKATKEAKEAETQAIIAQTKATEAQTEAIKAQTKVTFELVCEMKKEKQNKSKKDEIATLQRFSSAF